MAIDNFDSIIVGIDYVRTVEEVLERFANGFVNSNEVPESIHYSLKKSKRIEEKERKKKKREVQASMSKKYIMHDE